MHAGLVMFYLQYRDQWSITILSHSVAIQTRQITFPCVFNVFCFSAYTTIVSLDQRLTYKAEFNQYYAKYRKLHNVLDQVSKKFAHLENKLKGASRGSGEFKVKRHFWWRGLANSLTSHFYRDC